MNQDLLSAFSQKLQFNLKYDLYNARCIQSLFMRYLYRKVIMASTYLFSIIIAQLAFSDVIQNFQPITYYRKCQANGTVWLIWTIGFGFLLVNIFGTTKLRQFSFFKDQYRSVCQFIVDLITAGLYYSVYIILNIQFFSKQEANNEQNFTRHLIFMLYLLFLIRKGIFWINIFMIQGNSSKFWKDTVNKSDVEKVRIQLSPEKTKEIINTLKGIYKTQNNVNRSAQ